MVLWPISNTSRFFSGHRDTETFILKESSQPMNPFIKIVLSIIRVRGGLANSVVKSWLIIRVRGSLANIVVKSWLIIRVRGGLANIVVKSWLIIRVRGSLAI